MFSGYGGGEVGAITFNTSWTRLRSWNATSGDRSSVVRVIREVRPDKVFHLAAQSYVVTSWHAPEESLTTNIVGNLNLLEAIREAGIDPLIQVAGSSE